MVTPAICPTEDEAPVWGKEAAIIQNPAFMHKKPAGFFKARAHYAAGTTKERTLDVSDRESHRQQRRGHFPRLTTCNARTKHHQPGFLGLFLVPT